MWYCRQWILYLTCGAVPFILVFDLLFFKIMGPKPVPSDFGISSVGLSGGVLLLEDFGFESTSLGDCEPELVSGPSRFINSDNISSILLIFWFTLWISSLTSTYKVQKQLLRCAPIFFMKQTDKGSAKIHARLELCAICAPTPMIFEIIHFLQN